MIWTKNLKKIFSSGKNITVFLIPGLLLVLAILSLAVFFSFFFTPSKKPDLKPVKYVEINEPFSGQLYFNNEMGTDIFSSVIVPAIDGSKKTIELAVYSMDDTRIRDALYRAAERGVSVTLIFSDKRETGHDQVFKDMPTAIKRLDLSSAEGSMHHKFLLIDRNTPAAKLFFGSYNFTYLQEKYDPCFLLETTRPEIITVFGEEFERLRLNYHGLNKLAVSPDPFAALIRYPEGFLEIWFSPQPETGGLKERMMGLIKEAKNSIKVMIWDFTNKDLATELAVAARQKNVKIITDDYNYKEPGSVFDFLTTEKIKHRLDDLEIITDAKRNQEIKDKFKENDLNSFLHHHLLLIDDSTVVFGTNNWSNNGFYNNDESIIVSNIGSLVKPFGDVWQFNYDKNK
jgi:phosphatidylserine/phosphatidylglycerophosphate/cardiolipin synthase-like enzyme